MNMTATNVVEFPTVEMTDEQFAGQVDLDTQHQATENLIESIREFMTFSTSDELLRVIASSI